MAVREITIPHNFEPRDYQRQLFEAMDGVKGKPETKKKRAFLRWHRQAGKDYACAAYLFKEAARKKGVYYYFFPTYEQGRKALWEKPAVKDLLPGEVIASENNLSMTIKLTNGSIIRVVGTDKIDAVRGVTLTGAVFSEYSVQDPTAWKVMSPTFNVTGGWVIFNGTPTGRNHMYEMEKHIKYSDNWYFSELQGLWPDRDHYTTAPKMKEIIAGEIEMGAEKEWLEQEYGVSYTSGITGSYYSQHIKKVREEKRAGSFVYDDNIPVDTYWDLGRNDSTAIWFGQTIGNKVVFVDYLEESNKDLVWYADELIDKNYRYGTHFLPHDGNRRIVESRLTSQEILATLFRDARISDDVIVVERPRLKIDAINAVRRRFSKYYFNTDCMEMEDALSKLEFYHKKYNAKLGRYSEEQVKDWTSHCADALTTEAIAFERYGTEATRQDKDIEVLTDYDIYS